MSGPRFTPGPWRFRVANAAYPNICDIEAGDNYFDRTIIGFTAANCEASQANARLIAAAPELYEALEGVCNGDWSLSKARSVLAKARGDQ